MLMRFKDCRYLFILLLMAGGERRERLWEGEMQVVFYPSASLWEWMTLPPNDSLTPSSVPQPKKWLTTGWLPTGPVPGTLHARQSSGDYRVISTPVRSRYGVWRHGIILLLAHLMTHHSPLWPGPDISGDNYSRRLIITLLPLWPLDSTRYSAPIPSRSIYVAACCADGATLNLLCPMPLAAKHVVLTIPELFAVEGQIYRPSSWARKGICTLVRSCTHSPTDLLRCIP